MKKTLFSIALAIATTACYAQTPKVKTDTVITDISNGTFDQTTQSLKPTTGAIVTELNFNPFKGNLSLNNSLNQIKVRYFISPDVALRLGFHASQKDSTANVNNPYGPQGVFIKNERKSTLIGFNLGVEKHFKGTRRLSPYIAADISISSKSANQEIKDNDVSTSIKNGWLETVFLPNNQSYYTMLQENAYTRYGINLITGFDFYIAKDFFFGYEFNFSLSKTQYKNIETKVTSLNNSTGQPNTNFNDTGKKSASTFGPTLINGVRIGYSF
nr:hypothetical protein [Pedobacter panaciterrae]